MILRLLYVYFVVLLRTPWFRINIYQWNLSTRKLVFNVHSEYKQVSYLISSGACNVADRRSCRFCVAYTHVSIYEEWNTMSARVTPQTGAFFKTKTIDRMLLSIKWAIFQLCSRRLQTINVRQKDSTAMGLGKA